MYHYTYEIINLVKKKSYIGRRSSPCLPVEDLGIIYFSHSVDKDFILDQKKNPQNYKYKILGIFTSVVLAIDYEIYLHNKFDVAKNPSYYNLANQTTNGFTSVVSKPVLQIDKDTGEIIKKWNSQTEAINVVGVNKDSLRWCMEGKQRQAKDFVWLSPEKYTKEIAQIIRNTNYSRKGINCHRSKIIFQVDKNTLEIKKEWISATLLANRYGIEQTYIAECARNLILYKEYYLVYKKDYNIDFLFRKIKDRENHKRKISEERSDRQRILFNSPDNPRLKKVIKIDLETKAILNNWPSMKEAKKSVGYSHLDEKARNRIPYKGYLYIYEENYKDWLASK